jgi:hypothetical protein
MRVCCPYTPPQPHRRSRAQHNCYLLPLPTRTVKSGTQYREQSDLCDLPCTTHKPTSHTPTSHTPASHTPTCHTPTCHPPTGHTPTSHTPTEETRHTSTRHTPTSHTGTRLKPTSHTPTSRTPIGNTPTGNTPTRHTPTSHTPTSHTCIQLVLAKLAAQPVGLPRLRLFAFGVRMWTANPFIRLKAFWFWL